MGTKAFLDEQDFISEFQRLGATKLAKTYNLNVRTVLQRRANIEASRGIPIRFSQHEHLTIHRVEDFPGRLTLNIYDGVVIVAGDAHYWPAARPSLMHKALVHFTRKFAEEKSLRAIVMNGDVTDFPRLSHWPNVDWQKRPTVRDEIEVCTDRLHEIATAAGKIEKIWTLGNHDARWSIYLARNAAEIEGVTGINLKDHFPLWSPCWSLMVNPDHGAGTAFIKHRGSSAGKHAASLNVEKAGYSTITNHLHNAQVRPYNDLRPYTLYGVDTGCIADPYGPQFLYLEDNPRNWRSAFAILTFKDGKLMMPELVLGWNEKQVQFRGGLVKP